MGEIAAKFVDALSMFWQALDEQERKMLLIGGAYFVAVVVSSLGAEKRRQRERELTASLVLERLRDAR